VSVCVWCSANVVQLREEYRVADDAHRKLMEQRFGRKNIQRLIEDSYSEEWVSDNAKKCPQCSTNIQVCVCVCVFI